MARKGLSSIQSGITTKLRFTPLQKHCFFFQILGFGLNLAVTLAQFWHFGASKIDLFGDTVSDRFGVDLGWFWRDFWRVLGSFLEVQYIMFALRFDAFRSRLAAPGMYVCNVM